MKKLLLLFITTSFVLSQNLIEYVSDIYENGAIKTIKYYQRVSNKIVQAREENYYEDGLIKSEEYYKDGKRDGKWTYYYENGQIKEEGNYKDGKLDGKLTYYNKDGSIKEVYEYKDGKLDGLNTYYNINENGEILSLVSLPDYDLNKRASIDKDIYTNKITLGVYEFGSVFKTFTLIKSSSASLGSNLNNWDL